MLSRVDLARLHRAAEQSVPLVFLTLVDYDCITPEAPDRYSRMAASGLRMRMSDRKIRIRCIIAAGMVVAQRGKLLLSL